MLTSTATGSGTIGGSPITRLALADGSGAHPWRQRLADQVKARDLGDVIHALCAVHGAQPGLVETASYGAPSAWMGALVDGFAAERRYLARLVTAAGPLPSTPGQAQSEAALLTQRHALEMLARSERSGCAIGAVAALAADWTAIRPVLDRAALRFGLDVAPCRFDGAGGLPDAPERAVAFGAQQLLAQHRALWDLLEARASARG